MIAIIVAHSENHVIGDKGRIPWNIDGEKERFKELTTGNIVIMGRHTFEEIGEPLPNRFTILVSTTMKYESDNCITVPTLEHGIKIGKSKNKDIYISGGEQIYKKAIDMHIVDKMYITIVHKNYEGDTFFPEVNKKAFIETFRKHNLGEIPYTYITYEKINR